MEQELEKIIMKEIDTWNINLRNNSSSIKPTQKVKFLLYGLAIEAATRIYAETKNDQKKKHPEGVDYSNLSFKEATNEFVREYLLSQLERHNNVPQKAAEASAITCDSFRYHMVASKISVREIRESLSKTDKSEEPFDSMEIIGDLIDSYNVNSKGRIKTFISRNKQKIANRLSEVITDAIDSSYLDFKPGPSPGLYFQDDYIELNFKTANRKFKKDYLEHMINKHYCKNLRPVAEAIGINYGAIRVTLTRAGVKLSDVVSKQL